jgi:hypothetical protein
MDRLIGVQDEGDDGRTGGFACSDSRLIEGVGKLLGWEHDGRFADFPWRRGPEAELADSKSFAGRDRRPEDAAGFGARVVEIAGAVCGIEGRAGFLVGKVLEVSDRIAVAVHIEDAGGGIAGKCRLEACP